MNNFPYKISVYCPITRKEEAVYLYPSFSEEDDTPTFNGCDSNFHNGRECKNCKKKAIEKLKSQ